MCGETFNEADKIIEEADQALLTEADCHSNITVKNKPKRKTLPKELLCKRVTIYLSIDEQICDYFQGKLHKVGEDRSEKLEFITA